MERLSGRRPGRPSAAPLSDRRPNAVPLENQPPDSSAVEDLRAPPPARTLRWVAAVAGASVVRAVALEAGSSAVHGLLLDDGHRLVLRRYVRAEWLRREPDLAAREAAVLEHLGGRAVAPRLVACDPTAERTDAPAVLMRHLPGAPEWPATCTDAFLSGLVGTLRAVHAITPTAAVRAYRPHNLHLPPMVPRWARTPQVWRDAFDVYTAPIPETPGRRALLHRDFHQGNVLWEHGRVSGLVDWANASAGDPHADVGHCRMNLALWSGRDAADRFLAEYGRSDPVLNDQPYDPRWDVIAAAGSVFDLRLRGLDQARRLDRFVHEAMLAIESRIHQETRR